MAEPPEAMVALGPRSGRSGMAKAKGGSSATNMVIDGGKHAMENHHF